MVTSPLQRWGSVVKKDIQHLRSQSTALAKAALKLRRRSSSRLSFKTEPAECKETLPAGPMPTRAPSLLLAGDAPGPQPTLTPSLLLGRNNLQKARLERSNERRSTREGACVRGLLDSAYESWDFDAFLLSEVTQCRPLSTLGVYLFHRCGLVADFQLDRAKLSHFLEKIEDGYPESNPYHNRAHAASVLHSMHALLLHGGLMASVSTPVKVAEFGSSAGPSREAQLVRMACFVAAAIHDYEHMGVTNKHLVRTNHNRAEKSHESPNEYHHVTAALDVLLRDKCNFLDKLSPDEFARLCELVVPLVLATDMALHISVMEEAQEASREEGVKPFLPLLKLGIKCADLGHLTQKWGLHHRWVQRLQEESFLQGDAERSLGLRVSLRNDRTAMQPIDSQVSFINFMAMPLFELLVQFAPTTQPLLTSLEANLQQWKEIEAN